MKFRRKRLDYNFGTNMLSKIVEGIYDNDYVFLSVATCAVVIIPILFCYILSWSRTLMAAF